MVKKWLQKIIRMESKRINVNQNKTMRYNFGSPRLINIQSTYTVF